MSEYLKADGEKTARLKAVIDRLAAGASPQTVKREFHELIKGADAAEVAAMEQSLIEGGMPVEEVQRLCEVHADVFKAGLERGAKQHRLPGHPVHTYMAENREARKRARALSLASWASGAEGMHAALEDLKPVITHYERKENQLFPFLERTGFTGPSKVMWGKHDEIRESFKELESELESGSVSRSRPKARDLARRVRTMIFMEEKILFPNALKRLSDADWAAVRRGEEAIGFAWIRPGAEWDPALASRAPHGTAGSRHPNLDAAIAAAGAPDDAIALSVGSLPRDILDRILKSLPVDISFVDAQDRVRYYSDSPERVFPRSPGIIGREVRNCHPPKSVATVERILDAFRKKEKDRADFWIQMGPKFVYISYKPIYDDEGNYQGTLEMSMDATELRSLTGQRRLLDW